MAFDHLIQKIVNQPGSGVGFETGRVTIADVSGDGFTVATKFKRVLFGLGVMEGDGLIAVATPGASSGGDSTWKRCGPIATASDVVQYFLVGI